MVEVLDPLNPRKDQDQNGESKASTCSAPTITLEVPGFSFGKCLSPIKELPSPMPTPIPSPIPFQRTKSSQEELSSSSSSSGKSSSSKKAAANLLNNRRSSFTSFCKKAAASANAGSAGKRRSSTNSLMKSSMSTSDEDMIPMQEIKVPIIVTSSNIPLITLTEPDDEPFAEEDEEVKTVTDEDEEVELPEIAVSPPSPRPCRKDFKVPEIIEDPVEIKQEANDQVPMIQITIDSPSSEPSSALPSKPAKFKPPPIIIPNSNFLNFENKADKAELQNVPKDAMSKPEESIRIIELGERRTKTPNADQQQSETSLKVDYNSNFSFFFIPLSIDLSSYIGFFQKFPIYAAS